VDQSKYIILSTGSIREALTLINENKLGMILVVDDDQRVIGTATDGDIRGSLLGTATLEDGVDVAFNKDFVWRYNTDNRESILKLLDSKIKVIPILDKALRLVDIITPLDFPVSFEKYVYARAKAPVRISFAGGGSDLTHYFLADKGAVLSATVGLYSHVTLRPRNDSKVSVNSLDLNDVRESDTLSDFLSKKDGFDLFRSVFQVIKPSFGFDLYVYSDFPPGSGLGGSSAVMAAVLGCFNEFRSDKWNDYDLAELAFQAERINMGISGGWQDQYATVFGGFNFIEFGKDNNVIHPLRLNKKTILDLQESLVLIKVGSGRNSGHIHDSQEDAMQDSQIKNKVEKNVEHCYAMREHLLRSNLKDFGLGLSAAWQLKKQFSSEISNSRLDEVYNYALRNGALGGKLLGAGGGGFFLFYVKDFEKNSFLSAMKKKSLVHKAVFLDQDGVQSWTNRDDLKGN